MFAPGPCRELWDTIRIASGLPHDQCRQCRLCPIGPLFGKVSAGQSPYAFQCRLDFYDERRVLRQWQHSKVEECMRRKQRVQHEHAVRCRTQQDMPIVLTKCDNTEGHHSGLA